MKYFVLILIGLGAVGLYLLSTASANTELFARQYPALLAVNGLMVLLLLGAVAYQLLKLRRKLRAGVFGSKLTLRLVLAFALMAVLPGALLYGVSARFITKSIESWFNVTVEKALEGGLTVGRSALDSMLADLNAKSRGMALTLADLPASELVPALGRLREQAGVHEATLFGAGGNILALSGREETGLLPELPPAGALRTARLQQGYRAIEQIPDRGLVLRVVVPVTSPRLAGESRLLQVLQPVPTTLAQDLELVQAGHRDYQQLTLSRQGLKQLYGLTLTLALLVALLSALALALIISERLSAPLGLLAEGTRAVAKGDFSQLHPVRSRDELGVLTDQFNRMTVQLAEARAVAVGHQAAVEEARAYLESILGNLSSGVLAFDAERRLSSANPRASEILGTGLEALVRERLDDWSDRVPDLQPLTEAIVRALDGGESMWEIQVQRPLKTGMQALLARGTRLPEGVAARTVVVFDDVTGLIQAQREAAWREVARRLAHEIKNPLTPIQLAAERLEHKLAARLGHDDAEVLRRGSRTIVVQVAALKAMVDAFSQYARTPEASLQPLDLNGLVREVLNLYEGTGTTIEPALAADLPPVRGDPTQLRQVIHNLLQNAQDALQEEPAGAIRVDTAPAPLGVQLSVSDNGCGFAPELIGRATEPYTTTKPKGTGLGLAIVKKIVEEHRGTLTIENIEPHGARIRVTLPRAA